jgi:hypothetical protein
MRKASILPIIGLLTWWIATATAAEKAPDTYVKNMKDISAAMLETRSAVEAKDFAAVGKNAASLKALLKTTEAFWAQRKVQDAVAQSKAANKAVDDLATAAKAKNEAGLTTAQRALNVTCNECHTAHREKMPDGKYGIK